MLHFNYITCLAKKLSNNISAISEKIIVLEYDYFFLCMLQYSQITHLVSRETTHTHTHTHTQIQEETNQ